jgi:hypothetical protein
MSAITVGSLNFAYFPAGDRHVRQQCHRHIRLQTLSYAQLKSNQSIRETWLEFIAAK